jgi:methylglyoxal/glyoxal reductase
MNLTIDSTIELSNGVAMPRFGLGTARMTDPQVASQAVKMAIQHGYRLIDTSKNYDNEEYVGRGIRESGVPESEIFLTTKLEGEDYGSEQARRAFEGSRQRLGLRVVDLYLVHAPERTEQLRIDSWQALINLVRGDHLRAIGVSNYEITHLEEIFQRQLQPPTVNQIELSPFNYGKQRRLVDFCQEHDIRLMAYSPLGVGEALDDPRLQKLAQRYGKDPAQLLIRWSLQHDFIVIPKSDQEDHIRQNAQVFDFEIEAQDMKAMDSW